MLVDMYYHIALHLALISVHYLIQLLDESRPIMRPHRATYKITGPVLLVI